jgi:hypothetical protein
MAKPVQHNQPWTPAHRELRDLAGASTPTRVMALKLGRTEEAVLKHASDIGASVKPRISRQGRLGVVENDETLFPRLPNLWLVGSRSSPPVRPPKSGAGLGHEGRPRYGHGRVAAFATSRRGAALPGTEPPCAPDRRGDEDADGHSPHMKKSMKPGSRPYENSGGMRTAILDAMPH